MISVRNGEGPDLNLKGAKLLRDQEQRERREQIREEEKARREFDRAIKEAAKEKPRFARHCIKRKSRLLRRAQLNAPYLKHGLPCSRSSYRSLRTRTSALSMAQQVRGSSRGSYHDAHEGEQAGDGSHLAPGLPCSRQRLLGRYALREPDGSSKQPESR